MLSAKWNYAVDWAGFALFGALAGTGLLLHFNLPPGSGSSTVMGMTRHEWGDVHFWIAVGLAAIITGHLLMHARWIKGMALGRRDGAARKARGWGAGAVAALILVLAGALALWPAVRTPGSGSLGSQHVPPGGGHGEGHRGM